MARKDIPIFIDKVEDRGDRKILRMYFFVISLQEKMGSFHLPTECEEMLIACWGDEMEQLAPAVSRYASAHRFCVRAALTGGRFHNAAAVRQLFTFFDEHGLDVETEYLTVSLPCFSVPDGIGRGDVYRFDLERLLIDEQGEPVIYLDGIEMEPSEQETNAFVEWNNQVIAEVKENYRENPEQNLRQRRAESEK